MASFGRLNISALQGTQETTLALANFNVDFSLVKVEAPAEFQGLGACLSKKRKVDAEDGSAHITARKLGALFEADLPDVPNVIQAYGRRVTEIAEMPNVNPRGGPLDGAFADHVGADATTIWAAATSGSGAIAVHLLACMLARIWTPPEAVSIWYELVMQQKEIIGRRVQGHQFHFSMLAASRVDVSRTQLADWDSSARSWLRTADEAKKTQQTQLKLIIDNLNIPVTIQSNVHAGVMEAWMNALTTLDKLILGMPQRVQHGAILLGLCAWHLYPNLHVVGRSSANVQQNDPLISLGGVATLGLQSQDPHEDRGVYWSLPLAHLRYYGDPVTASQCIGTKSSRVSFDMFLQVALGNLLGGWGSSGGDITACAELIITISNLFHAPRDLRWLGTLSRAAKNLVSSTGTTRVQLTRLIDFGRRRCTDLISTPESILPAAFGLADIGTLVNLFESPKEKVDFLRTCAEALDVDLGSAVIRFHTNFMIKFTSLSQNPRRAEKRIRRDHSEPDYAETEWLELDSFFEASQSQGPYTVIDGVVQLDLDERPPELQQYTSAETPDLYPTADGLHFSLFPVNLGRDLVIIRCPLGPGESPVECDFVCGDVNTAAIFRKKTETGAREKPSNLISPKELRRLLSLNIFAREKLRQQICSQLQGDQAYSKSLSALEYADHVYSMIRHADVDLSVTSRPLHSWKWNSSASPEAESSLRKALSCVACFETGCIELKLQELEDVMAMSYGNSIYVAQRLLCDPADPLAENAITRIVGNIGRPGLSLLVPPKAPKMRRPDYESWNVINHEIFNGKFEDSFSGTSLHLSFTGYELALDIGSHGDRDKLAYYLEAVISVYDSGEWVADLDILEARKKWGWVEVDIDGCAHSSSNASARAISNLSPPCSMAAVDTWAEFLDRPLQVSVVRSTKNQWARLSAATIASQRGYNFCIAPNLSCVDCLRDAVYNHVKEYGYVSQLVLPKYLMLIA